MSRGEYRVGPGCVVGAAFYIVGAQGLGMPVVSLCAQFDARSRDSYESRITCRATSRADATSNFHGGRDIYREIAEAYSYM